MTWNGLWLMQHISVFTLKRPVPAIKGGAKVPWHWSLEGRYSPSKIHMACDGMGLAFKDNRYTRQPE